MKPITTHKIFDIFVAKPHTSFTAQDIKKELANKKVKCSPEYLNSALTRLVGYGVFNTGVVSGVREYCLTPFLQSYYANKKY